MSKRKQGVRKNTRPGQRAQHVARVAELVMKGWSQKQIGDELGVSRRMVGYDIAQLEEMWHTFAMHKIDVHKAREIAKWNHLESVYWEAWEKSLEKARSTTRSAKTSPKLNRKTQKVENVTDEQRVTQKEEERLGDWHYLSGIERCIRERCALLGIIPPRRIIEEPDAGWGVQPADVPLEKLSDLQLAALRKLYRERRSLNA